MIKKYALRQTARRHSQSGLTLIIGMLMLLLITIMVTAAFNLSTTNSKSVANTQFRDEAIAAANKGIEQTMSTILSTGFMTLPTAPTTYTLDINNDGTADYNISIAIPVCTQTITMTGSGSTGGSSALLGAGFSGSSTYYNSMWDIAATVTDALSGTSIAIHQGVRIALSEAQKPAVCP